MPYKLAHLLLRPRHIVLSAAILALLNGCTPQGTDKAPQVQAQMTEKGDTSFFLLVNGDTVPTGVARPLAGSTISPDSLAAPVVVKAGAPTVRPYTRAGTEVGAAAQIVRSVAGHSPLGPLADPEEWVPQTEMVTPRFTQPSEAMPPRFKDDAALNVQYLDVDQGMPSPYVYSVIEDSRGHLWMGTYNGVARYDGRSFLYFTLKNGLSSNQVKAILEDRAGNLWFGTQGGGVCMYDGQRFSQFNVSDSAELNSVFSLFQDAKGDMWLGTEGAGVVLMHDGRATRYTRAQGLSGNRVWSIGQDRNGVMWFATVDGGITRMEGSDLRIMDETVGMPSNKVRTLAVDRDGILWAGTHGGGLVRYNGVDLAIYRQADGLMLDMVSDLMPSPDGSLWAGTPGAGAMHLTVSEDSSAAPLLRSVALTETDGLSGSRVSDMLRDSYGNIWLATEGGGVNRIASGSFTHFTTNVGISGNYVYSLASDRSGNVWMGTLGAGADLFDGRSFSNWSTAQGLASNDVWAILADSRGRTWFGTRGGGVSCLSNGQFTHYNSTSGLSGDHVMCIVEDHAGNIWFGTKENGITRFDGTSFTHYGVREGLSNNRILSLLVDMRGRLWVGTNGSGACLIDQETITYITPREGLANTGVISMCESADGAIWFGTDQGVTRLYESRFTSIRAKDGLANESVWSVGQGPDGSMWFGTMRGLTRMVGPSSSGFAIEKCRFRTFLKEDGLRANDFPTNTVLRDKMGRMWWGTGSALTMLPPDPRPQGDTGPPTYQDFVELNQRHFDFRLIADTTLANDTARQAAMDRLKGSDVDSIMPYFNYPRHLVLPSTVNHLTFHFTAIDWAAPHKVRFQFRLNGGEWGPPTSENKAVFANMPNGEHTFEVRAMDHTAAWGPPFAYRFEVRPPWWLTWWAFLLYVGTSVLSVMGIFRWRTASLLERQRELEQVVEERTHALVEEKTEVIRQKEQVQKQNHEILESIDYAKRLQEAVLPAKENLDRLFSDSFLLYLPRDIVSGDFYWAEEVDGDKYFAVADCTGHGVPGAMLSIIGLNALHRSLGSMAIRQPKDLLTQLSQEIQTTFASSGKNTVRDGMDIALCRLSRDCRKLSFSGANNPLWVLRNGELIEAAPDRRPIGYFEFDKPFTQSEMEVMPGDTIYLFSDGYTSQQGGTMGKKLMRGQFRTLLLGMWQQPLHEQREQLHRFVIDWGRGFEQTDDICILAIRL